MEIFQPEGVRPKEKPEHTNRRKTVGSLEAHQKKTKKSLEDGVVSLSVEKVSTSSLDAKTLDRRYQRQSTTSSSSSHKSQVRHSWFVFSTFVPPPTLPVYFGRDTKK